MRWWPWVSILDHEAVVDRLSSRTQQVNELTAERNEARNEIARRDATVEAYRVEAKHEYDNAVTYKSYADTMTRQRDEAVARAERAETVVSFLQKQIDDWTERYEKLQVRWQQLVLVGAREMPAYVVAPAKERDLLVEAINQRAGGDANLRNLMLAALKRDRAAGVGDVQILAAIEAGVDGAESGLPV